LQKKSKGRRVRQRRNLKEKGETKGGSERDKRGEKKIMSYFTRWGGMLKESAREFQRREG